MNDPPSPITDDRLQQCFDYWLRQAAGSPMPSRGDIDPLDIIKLLPHIMLVDVLDDGRYRYRLIGTSNMQEHGINATGRYLDEVLPGPEYRDHVLRLYDECVQSRQPVYSESLFMRPGRLVAERHTKVLFLPLAPNGERVNMVFVAQVFSYLDPNSRDRHLIEGRPYKVTAHARLQVH
jgi:hypothetical protein